MKVEVEVENVVDMITQLDQTTAVMLKIAALHEMQKRPKVARCTCRVYPCPTLALVEYWQSLQEARS